MCDAVKKGSHSFFFHLFFFSNHSQFYSLSFSLISTIRSNDNNKALNLRGVKDTRVLVNRG